MPVPAMRLCQLLALSLQTFNIAHSCPNIRAVGLVVTGTRSFNASAFAAIPREVVTRSAALCLQDGQSASNRTLTHSRDHCIAWGSPLK
jgi:hypothetical protein